MREENLLGGGINEFFALIIPTEKPTNKNSPFQFK